MTNYITKEYSQKTADLIAEMIAISQRKDYVLEKEKIEQNILKTYNIFNLPRPKKIVWFKDLTEKFLENASRAYSAHRESNASSAYRASIVFSESNAYNAYSESSAYNAFRASSEFNGYNAFRASRASRAYRAYNPYSVYNSSIDYDLDWFVLAFEYNEKEKNGNKNDIKYLKYSNLLLQAKKQGLGYWCDFDDILYFVPCPIISFDKQIRFHSIENPAIFWKEGEAIYYIHGVKFDKELWEKVVNGKLSAKEVFALENMEQRRIAYEMMDKKKMLELGAETLDEVKDDGYGNSMKIIKFSVKGFDEPFIFLNCFCPTTKREYFLQTDKVSCLEAKISSFGLDKEILFDKEW